MTNRLLGFIALLGAPVLLIAVSGLVNPSLSQGPPSNPTSGLAKTDAAASTNSTSPKVDVAFKDSALSLTIDSAGMAKGNLFLQNTGEVPAEVEFSVALANGKAEVTIQDENKRIEINEIKAFPISIKLQEGDPPLSGYLRMKAAGVFPATTKVPDASKEKVAFLTIKLNPPPPDAYTISSPLFVAFVLTVISYGLLAFKEKIGLFRLMGSAKWSFKDSWASNITVASGALITLLTFASLPEQTVHFSKIGYAVLSFLFAALIGLAPIIYNLLRKEIEAIDPDGNPVVQYQGYVITFLLACMLTIWGVMGQMGTLWFTLDEIWKAGLIVKTIIRLFQYLLIGAVVALAVYSGISIYRTIKKQIVVEENTRESLRARAREEAPPVDVKPALPDWPTL